MTRLRRALVVVCTVLVAVTAAPVPAAAVPRGVLASCARIHALFPFAPDGNYVLLTRRFLLGVYCHDMAGRPREYLTLANTGRSANFSQYTAGGPAAGISVRTSFTRLRVNPATLTVDINDLTFATSTGRLTHAGRTVTAMPYASAMACDLHNAFGRGNVDLRGTAFVLADTFRTDGFVPFGSVAAGPRDQLVDLVGGGYCGWIAPSPGAADPVNPRGRLPILELGCAPDGLFRPQVCLTRP
ncbi:GON domain-containing protein [Actinophytocola xanthii]|uniref:GON domain-containing protein n=1 Tax=Actinophytocola xanthii TaxID=1912961 RepID=A0A1Q8C1P7_9PSEU|nr:GON domain-containing protein [Actinophytocola xanthii]OLF08259.1 hypothetical protein BU204_34605 [Actinophytocola xanthii]